MFLHFDTETETETLPPRTQTGVPRLMHLGHLVTSQGWAQTHVRPEVAESFLQQESRFIAGVVRDTESVRDAEDAKAWLGVVVGASK